MKKLFIAFIFLCPLFTMAQVTDSLQRQLILQGAVNVRDLGGYVTKDGHHIKWNKLYRGADISKLTDADLDRFSKKKINYVVDLRGDNEAKVAPDRLNKNADYLRCPAGCNESLTGWMKKLMNLQTGGDTLMIAYYTNTEFLAARYKPFFEKLIALPTDEALLFHCTAGKDRTGIGAALLLHLLGVPAETIMSDYLASNIYRASDNEKMVQQMVQQMHVKEQVARDISLVKKEYLNATLAMLVKQYGSINNFLKSAIGLDDGKISMLKSKFLE